MGNEYACLIRVWNDFRKTRVTGGKGHDDLSYFARDYSAFEGEGWWDVENAFSTSRGESETD
jgi:hypothetical protein